MVIESLSIQRQISNTFFSSTRPCLYPGPLLASDILFSNILALPAMLFVVRRVLLRIKLITFCRHSSWKVVFSEKEQLTNGRSKGSVMEEYPVRTLDAYFWMCLLGYCLCPSCRMQRMATDHRQHSTLVSNFNCFFFFHLINYSFFAQSYLIKGHLKIPKLQSFHCCVIGPAGSGKSTLIGQYIFAFFPFWSFLFSFFICSCCSRLCFVLSTTIQTTTNK